MSFTKYLLSAIVLLNVFVSYAQDANDITRHQIDSIKAVADSKPDGISKVCDLKRILTLSNNAEEEKFFAEELYALSKRIGSKPDELYSLYLLAYSAFTLHDLNACLKYSFELIASSGDEEEYIKMKAMGYVYAGNVYSVRMDKGKADEYYHLALAGFESIRDSNSCLNVNYNIAQNYLDYNMFDLAEKHFRTSLEMSREMGNLEGASDALWGIGMAALQRYDKLQVLGKGQDYLYKAKSALVEAYNIAKDNQIPSSWMKAATGMTGAMVSLVDTKSSGVRKQELLDSCQMALEEAYAIIDRFGSEGDKMHVDMVDIAYQTAKGNFARSKFLIDSIKSIFDENPEEYKNLLPSLYMRSRIMSERKNDFKQALHDMDMFSYWHAESLNEDFAVKSAQQTVQVEFDELMRQREIEVKQNEVRMEEENKRMTIVSIAIAVVLFLIGMLAVQQMRNIRKQKKINRELDVKNGVLEEQKEEILAQNEYLEQHKTRIELQNQQLESQNEIITKANHEINDSINYASLIQRAAMPSQEMMNQIFGDSLLVYHPLMTVSGDFYWAAQSGDIKMLAVADCTGHGVPGAFLSILGISTLNSIVGRTNVSSMSASQILDELRSVVKSSLRQNGMDDDNRDGMDMALVVIDTKRGTMQYAGAFRPLVLIREGNVNKVDADRMPIGSHIKEVEHFTNHEIALQPNDMIYLFSDGLTDQFGYDERGNVHKYTMKRFLGLLSDVCQLSFDEQKTMVEDSIARWRRKDGDIYEQTDDAILVGIRYV